MSVQVADEAVGGALNFHATGLLVWIGIMIELKLSVIMFLFVFNILVGLVIVMDWFKCDFNGLFCGNLIIIDNIYIDQIYYVFP